MDIIKRLQLNKNPKDIKSGSVIGAKNIMLDPVSSTITNEYGFKSAYTAPSGYEIVGAIPCNEEIVIFLSTHNKSKSKIERLKDGKTIADPVTCNWKYEGGKITGTFAYNYKKQLIIAISEYDANHDVPLKILNLDDNNLNLDNNLEENIPSINCNYNISSTGSLVCGTYTFFVRFKIDEQTYTKWFQLTDDIIITNFVTKDSPVHTYSNSGMTNVFNVNAGEFTQLYVNENLTSSSSIEFNISFDDNNFEKYQLGYIIKRNNETLGRLFKEFNVSDLNVSIIDNTFLEEVNLNDFLEIPTQFYNCKNLINYNNRLYISNYNTYKKENKNISNLVSANIRLLEVKDEIQLNDTTLVFSRGNLYMGDFRPNPSAPIEHFVPKQFTHTESVNFVGTYIYPYIKGNHSAKAVFIFKPGNTNLSEAVCIYSEMNNIPIDSSYYITCEEGHICINTANYKYILNGSECLNVVEDTNAWAYKQGYSYETLYYPNNPKYVTVFNSSYTTVQNVISELDIKYNNNRTLIPGQVYNFFIHFIRKDGSYTEGYNLKNPGSHKIRVGFSDITVENLECCAVTNTSLNDKYYFYKKDTYFQCPRFINKTTIDGSNNRKEFIIVPEFSVDNSLFGDEFIGYFISYERLEITSLPVVALNFNDNSNKQYEYTNTDLLYNNKILKGTKLASAFSGERNGVESQEDSIETTSISNDIYKEKKVIIKTEDPFVLENAGTIDNNYNDFKTIVKIDRTSLYNSKYKVLYRLTSNIYKNDTYDYTKSYMYLPGFYNREKIVYYNNALIFNAASTFVYKKNNTSNQILNESYKIKSICYRNYSHVCLNAFSIKQDYEQAANVLNINGVAKTYINRVLAPNKLPDFLELQQAYKSEPVISYTNYNENTQDRFDKTIYRSDVISDESLTNGFRHFNIENYKNIIENKGNIVNIIGVGLYLLVHTEYSLFIFDRNNQLTNEAQLQIPDVFDIDYKEMTPSGEGFGGLRDKEESILTKHGYIWFDHITKSIFIFDGQQIKPISADIHNLLKEYMRDDNCAYIRFAEDYISNRLLITIKSDYTVKTYITLSYSFDTNCFISLHDYTFDKNYKTYNNSYLFSEDDKTNLYIWHKGYSEYGTLSETRQTYGTIKVNDELCSYVDIIFNDKYELPKTLNSISYILSRNNNYNYITNIIDKYFNTDFDNEKHQNKLRLYSGFKLYITTDLTFSGEIDISKDEEVNKLNSKKPQWNNGIWNFNWFRENIKKDVTNAELEQQNVNQQMKEVYQQHDNLYPSGLEKSDMRSLIHGKYFIFRFVFERNQDNLNLRFETLDVNISKL